VVRSNSNHNLKITKMKKIVLVLLISIYSINLFSQELETKEIYCEIVGTSTLLGKVIVEIDMGESKGFLSLNTSYLVDENGKAIKFNSMVDAMNYMGENGWEFAQAYVVSLSTSYVYHWLLTQTVEKGEDGEYYPVTKKAFGKD